MSRGSRVEGRVVDVTKGRPHGAWKTMARRLEFILSAVGSLQVALIRGASWVCLDVPIIRRPTVTDPMDWSLKVLGRAPGLSGVFGHVCQ